MGTLALFLYAIFKAFLPLPSLEVILIPMVIALPRFAFMYSIIGALGTFIGGAIGYGIAYYLGSGFITKLSSSSNFDNGLELVKKYGVLAVFIGGITPIPDFLLAYLAGLTRMNFLLFAFSDALARLLRSLLVSYLVVSFGYVIDLDKWGSLISLIIILYFLFKWGFSKENTKKKI